MIGKNAIFFEDLLYVNLKIKLPSKIFSIQFSSLNVYNLKYLKYLAFQL